MGLETPAEFNELFSVEIGAEAALSHSTIEAVLARVAEMRREGTSRDISKGISR